MSLMRHQKSRDGRIGNLAMAAADVKKEELRQVNTEAAGLPVHWLGVNRYEVVRRDKTCMREMCILWRSMRL